MARNYTRRPKLSRRNQTKGKRKQKRKQTKGKRKQTKGKQRGGNGGVPVSSKQDKECRELTKEMGYGVAYWDFDERRKQYIRDKKSPGGGSTKVVHRNWKDCKDASMYCSTPGRKAQIFVDMLAKEQQMKATQLGYNSVDDAEQHLEPDNRQDSLNEMFKRRQGRRRDAVVQEADAAVVAEEGEAANVSNQNLTRTPSDLFINGEQDGKEGGV